MDKSTYHKRVTGIFTGIEFTIRKVRIKEYMSEMGILPIEIVESVSEQLKKFSDNVREIERRDPDAEAKTIKFFLSRGVVSPKVWFGEEAACPADQILAEDLGSDTDYLIGQIAQWSLEMPGLKSLGRFLRGPGAGDPGSDSEEVRPEAGEPVPEGDLH